MEKKVITTHIPKDLADRLEQAAKSLDRPKAWVMKQALSDWLKEHQRKIKAIGKVGDE